MDTQMTKSFTFQVTQTTKYKQIQISPTHYTQPTVTFLQIPNFDNITESNIWKLLAAMSNKHKNKTKTKQKH